MFVDGESHMMPSGFLPSCDKYGYRSKQCHGDYCWCQSIQGYGSVTRRNRCLSCSSLGKSKCMLLLFAQSKTWLYSYK